MQRGQLEVWKGHGQLLGGVIPENSWSFMKSFCSSIISQLGFNFLSHIPEILQTYLLKKKQNTHMGITVAKALKSILNVSILSVQWSCVLGF